MPEQHPASTAPSHTAFLSRRPRRWLRILLKAPILLYRLRLGWLLGRRFLLVEHTGRTSGLTRRTVLEVVHHDSAAGTWAVAAAFGGRSTDWFQNIQKTPAVAVMVGARRWPARAKALDEAAAESILRTYAKAHARSWAQLYRMIIGDRFDGTDAAFGRFTARIPVVSFEPQ